MLPCNYSVSFAAASLARAISDALTNGKSGSESSRFWISSLCSPHTSLSLNATFNLVPNSQYSNNFFNSGKNLRFHLRAGSFCESGIALL